MVQGAGDFGFCWKKSVDDSVERYSNKREERSPEPVFWDLGTTIPTAPGNLSHIILSSESEGKGSTKQGTSAFSSATKAVRKGHFWWGKETKRDCTPQKSECSRRLEANYVPNWGSSQENQSSPMHLLRSLETLFFNWKIVISFK